jgi:hypothetical protein
MMRFTKTPWTDAEIERLKALIASGATLLRASVALKRPKHSVQSKARALGTPFPNALTERKKRRALLYP